MPQGSANNAVLADMVALGNASDCRLVAKLRAIQQNSVPRPVVQILPRVSDV